MLVGLGIFLVFVVGFGAWATMAPLAEASVAPGLIKVEGSRRTIQHLEGGAVREILFRDGAEVKAGEVIARLDVIQADSQLETQRAQRWALLAQDARLAAAAGRERPRT
jgi:HlyD family secretion protein